MNKILRYTGMIIFLVVFASATAVVPAQDTGDAFQMDNMLGPGCGLKVGKDGKIKISRDEQGDVTQIMARKSVQLVMPPDYKMDCNVLTFNKVGKQDGGGWLASQNPLAKAQCRLHYF